MKSLYFFGYYLNGLEFVTFIIIPTAIILMILLFFGFKSKLTLIISILETDTENDNDILDKLDNT